MILFETEIPATLAALSDARKQLRRALDDLRLASGLKDAIELALAEGGSNPVRHGSPAPSRLRLKVLAGSRGIETIIDDDGGHFNGFAAAFAAVRGMPDPLSEGGRGLPLLKEAMDRLDYHATDGWNRLSLFRRHKRRKLKLLIAEDSAATMEFFKAVLGDRHELVTAASVGELKEKLKPDINLVVSDLHLGDGKASDVLAALQQSRDGLDMPVILVTSDTSDQVVSDAVLLGTETVLAKPVRPKALLEAIDKALAAQARRQLSEARKFNALVEDIVSKPDFSTVAGFAVASRMSTAATGGGDLLIDLGGLSRRRIVLADLMGHGISARARAATWAGLLRGVQQGLEDSPPEVFANRFSQALCQSQLPEHVAGTLLVIDLLAGGWVEIANAGHLPPLLLAEGKLKFLPVEGAMPGLTEQVCTSAFRLHLSGDARLIAGTDGLDPESLAYRLDLPDSVSSAAIHHRHAPLETMAEAMAVAQNELTGYRPEDDWTLLVLQALA